MRKIALNKLLLSNGFTPPFYVEGCNNIREFLPDSTKTGIYVLHFRDETVYVGKSKEISRRFNQHSNNFTDIVAISFKEVDYENLDFVERDTVKLLEKNKVKLRNILLSSFTYNKTDFYDLVKKDEQDKWISEINHNNFTGERIENIELREKYIPNFEKFSRYLYSDKIIAFLKAYIFACIPFPIRTELSYWSLSCLPSSKAKILCRINIFWQEVLTIFEENQKLYFSFHMRKSEIPDNLLRKFIDNGIELFEHKYKPGGDNQFNLVVNTANKAMEVLNENEIQKSIRKFNLNLMRKGNCQYSRYHCFALADKVIEA